MFFHSFIQFHFIQQKALINNETFFTLNGHWHAASMGIVVIPCIHLSVCHQKHYHSSDSFKDFGYPEIWWNNAQK